MKLMAFGAHARGKKRAIRDFDLAIAQSFKPGKHPSFRRVNPCHGKAPTAMIDERFGEIHEAAALRVGETSRLDESQYCLAHRAVLGKLLGIELRIAAAQIEAIDVGGYSAVTNRAKRH